MKITPYYAAPGVTEVKLSPLSFPSNQAALMIDDFPFDPLFRVFFILNEDPDIINDCSFVTWKIHVADTSKIINPLVYSKYYIDSIPARDKVYHIFIYGKKLCLDI